jgi:hypothetical protein
MNGAPHPPDFPEPDLIDRIANALPAELQAGYYREMRYCRSLSENDEMLRILRAMQFWVVLMLQIPERIATERERLEQILTDFLKALREIHQSIAIHQAQLDQRLVQLPAQIAEGINPEAIAAKINESLCQQFVRSTIPATAEALAVAAAQMKKATSEFARSTSTLGDSYQGAAEEARRAVANLESASSHAISSTKRAAEELVRVFREEYRWSLFALLSIALLVGLGIGMFVEQRLSLPPHTTERTPVIQQPQPIKPRIKP